MLDDITKNEHKSKLLDYAKRNLQPGSGPHSFICPYCGSGTGPNGTSAFFIDPKTSFEKWKCFKCGEYGDIFDLAEKINGLDKGQGIQCIQAYYGNKSGSAPINPTSTRARAKETEKQLSSKLLQLDAPGTVKDHIAEYEQWQANLSQTDYLTGRGFTPEIIKRFRLGYNPHCWIAKDVQGPAIIIPCTNDYYLRRPLNPEKVGGVKYKTMPGRRLEASCFIGIQYLTEASSDPVFIVEGAFDAISIEQAGAAAISINSQSNKRLFIEYMRANKPQRPLIAALDPDEQAQKSQSEIIAAAREMGVTVIGFDFSTETAKDPNDLLKQGLPTLQAAIKTALRELDIKAKEAIAEEVEAERLKALEIEVYKSKTNVSQLYEAFTMNIETRPAAQSTGFKKLDELLDGGITGGSLICIGALSSLGKSTFALQIADQIAAQGQDVLFFALEMSKDELMAKSISRYTFANAEGRQNMHFKSTEILRYKLLYGQHADDEITYILNCGDKYVEAVGGCLYINECMKADYRLYTAEDIEQEVERHLDFTGNKPVVFVDYLQILAPPNERGTDKQNVDINVSILKRMAREHEIPVVIISALNRENYKTEINMAAFRDSSTIEYSSDILLGLQPELPDGEARNKFDVDAFKEQPNRPMELKILKNRNGRTGGKIPYTYNAPCNHFRETTGGNDFNFNRAGKRRGK